jgi:protein-S-isoprenylcysteine O-methyltransferase Ste14
MSHLMKYLRALAFAALTVLLYLGIPLLGWGPADFPGFFAIPARAGYAALVLIFAMAIGIQALGGTAGIRSGAGDRSKLVRRQHLVRILMLLAFYVALAFLPFADRRGIAVLGEGATARWAGLALAAAGYALVFWSGLALGRMYSQEVTLQEGHRLVTDGPYRVIRHPRYLGLLALTVGTSLVFRSWLGLAAIAPLLAVLLFRIHDEETLLGQQFGPDWEAYRRRTWRLVPGVY